MEKWCPQSTLFIFDRIFIKLAGNQDWHKISDEFEFRPDRISHFGVTCLWRRIKFSVDLLWNLQVLLTFQMKTYWVPCGHNSSYSFPPIVLKLFRCFLHGMKMCMWFWYNPLIIFSHFFCFVTLVVFRYEMLLKCIDSGYIMYLVGTTPLTVFHWLFWNIADVFQHGMKMCMWFCYNPWIIFFLHLSNFHLLICLSPQIAL